MKVDKIYNEEETSACYFRTAAHYPSKKCLIQITERCNLRCKHCFVSADNTGRDIDYDTFIDSIIPQLLKSNISKVTLTGGEPLVYRNLAEVVNALSINGIVVGICSNGVLINESFIEKIKDCVGVHFNISLDGFSPSTHGRFRGNEDPVVFEKIITNISLLGKHKLLKGILVTPNRYTPVEEYVEICKYAKEVGAKYVLMNPLSEFGRGELNQSLGLNRNELIDLKKKTQCFNKDDFQIVYIRFPNEKSLPISKCRAGDIMYIFTNGDIAYCPYMAFASKDRSSVYNYSQFIVGNCFEKSFNWDSAIEEYKLPCEKEDIDFNNIRNGCMAIKIANGLKLGDDDPIIKS